jgi:hypothetical protein
MKRMIAFAILLAGTSLITNNASAQQGGVQATVPFDFSVADRVLPQGTYRIVADGDFLSISNLEHSKNLRVLGITGETAKDGQPKLVFDRIGDQYFLRQIVSTTARTSQNFPKSKLEMDSREFQAQYKVNGLSFGR